MRSGPARVVGLLIILGTYAQGLDIAYDSVGYPAMLADAADATRFAPFLSPALAALPALALADCMMPLAALHILALERGMRCLVVPWGGTAAEMQLVAEIKRAFPLVHATNQTLPSSNIAILAENVPSRDAHSAIVSGALFSLLKGS